MIKCHEIFGKFLCNDKFQWIKDWSLCDCVFAIIPCTNIDPSLWQCLCSPLYGHLLSVEVKYGLTRLYHIYIYARWLRQDMVNRTPETVCSWAASKLFFRRSAGPSTKRALRKWTENDTTVFHGMAVMCVANHAPAKCSCFAANLLARRMRQLDLETAQLWNTKVS